MNVHEQIKDYIASQPEPKRGEMQALHDMILPILEIWAQGSSFHCLLFSPSLFTFHSHFAPIHHD